MKTKEKVSYRAYVKNAAIKNQPATRLCNQYALEN